MFVEMNAWLEIFKTWNSHLLSTRVLFEIARQKGLLKPVAVRDGEMPPDVVVTITDEEFHGTKGGL